MTKRLSERRIQQIAESSERTLHEHPSPSLESDTETNSEFGSSSNSSRSSSTLDNWHRKGSNSKNSIGLYERVTPVPSRETLRSFSSTSSWTDDGFERPATEKVQAIFDSIDGHLYDGVELQEDYKDLRLECQDWINKYPHLRVSGRHLDVVSDIELASITSESSLNFNDFSPSTSNSHESSSLNETKEIQTFVVRGFSLRPSFSEEQSEEILEQEGNYEELIAVDYNDFSFSPRNTSDEFRRRRAIKRLTDHFWNKIVLHLRSFLIKYVEIALRGPPQPAPPSRVSHILPIEDVRPTSDFPLPRLPTAPLMNKSTNDLDGLLTITSKMLLNRSYDKGMKSGSQTSTSTVSSGTRQQSPQQTVASKNSGRGRLVPLERSAKTTTKPVMYPVSGREATKQKVTIPEGYHPLSPSNWGRHFPLPPIESNQPLASTSITLQQKSRPSLMLLNRTMSENGNTNCRFTSRPILNSNSFSVSSANARAATSRLSSSVENDQSPAINNLVIMNRKPNDDRNESGSIQRRRSTVVTTDHLKDQSTQSILNRPRRMSSNNTNKKLNR